MSVETNNLQIIYNDFSIFLFNNLKILRKDIKKDIKKQLKQIGREYFLNNLKKYIHNIADDIIDSSRKKNVKKNVKDVNKKNNINIPNGYKLCNKERTKNRGLCKKFCKID
jgi:ATP-dependent Lon protease